jgi:hypothetical protein
MLHVFVRCRDMECWVLVERDGRMIGNSLVNRVRVSALAEPTRQVVA